MPRYSQQYPLYIRQSCAYGWISPIHYQHAFLLMNLYVTTGAALQYCTYSDRSHYTTVCIMIMNME